MRVGLETTPFVTNFDGNVRSIFECQKYCKGGKWYRIANSYDKESCSVMAIVHRGYATTFPVGTLSFMLFVLFPHGNSNGIHKPKLIAHPNASYDKNLRLRIVKSNSNFKLDIMALSDVDSGANIRLSVFGAHSQFDHLAEAPEPSEGDLVVEYPMEDLIDDMGGGNSRSINELESIITMLALTASLPLQRKEVSL